MYFLYFQLFIIYPSLHYISELFILFHFFYEPGQESLWPHNVAEKACRGQEGWERVDREPRAVGKVVCMECQKGHTL